MIKHAIKWLKDKNIYTEYICCVYPTSVFLNKKDLLDGYKKIKANKWDFVFTAAKSEKSAYHAFEKKNLDQSKCYSQNFLKKDHK